MRPSRVQHPTAVVPGDLVQLEAAEARHLVTVLRRAPGDPVVLIAAGGGSFAGRIESILPGRDPDGARRF